MGVFVPRVHCQRMARRPHAGKGTPSFSSFFFPFFFYDISANQQFWHIAGPIFMGAVGFIISMSTLNVAARYVALFLQAGSYAGFIVFYSWISSSFPRPPAKRAVAIAMINAFSQLGNVAGSYVWNLKDNGYRKSYGIVLSMFGVTVAGCWVLRVMLNRLNKQLEDNETTPEAQSQDVVDHADESLRMTKGFRYLV